MQKEDAIAHYLIVQPDIDPQFAMKVEADSIKAAIESLDLEHGESVKVYRIVHEAKVTVKEEKVRKVVVE